MVSSSKDGNVGVVYGWSRRWHVTMVAALSDQNKAIRTCDREGQCSGFYSQKTLSEELEMLSWS